MSKYWSEEETNYLKENYKTKSAEEISKHIGRSESSIFQKALKMGLKKDNYRWTKEEEDYLEDKWGVIPISTIAKKLNKTIKAVKMKAQRINLDAFLKSGDYVTFGELSKALGLDSNTYLLTKLINMGFPFEKKKVISKKVYIVCLKDFWKWAEKHQTAFDFSKFSKNNLGKEPDWVDEKRKRDRDVKHKYRSRNNWTKDEDERLIYLLNQFKYSYKEIAIRLGRTEGAITRRITDLGIKARPIRAINKIWSKEEENILTELIKKRYDYNSMSEVLGRSSKSVRGKVYNMYLTENIDKAAEYIGNGKFGDNRPPRTITSNYLNKEETTKVKQDLSKFIGILNYLKESF